LIIELEALDLKNAQDVYDFEVENRAYFEKYLPSRGEDYYDFEKYNDIIQAIIAEQGRGECLMYVIRDKAGKTAGRVNFSSIQNDPVKTAELGYRIGLAHTGKGIATKAVQLALQLAENHNLQKITAGTATENIASQKVLEKNGFSLIGKTENYMEQNGKSIDSFTYVKFLRRTE